MAPEDKDKVEQLDTQRPADTPKINWDDTQMKNSYANVCNAVGTREEVVLFFGLSNPSQTGDAEVTVQLSQRVILSPYAAKRLANMLENVVGQYESRWGPLGDIGTTVPPATKTTN